MPFFEFICDFVSEVFRKALWALKAPAASERRSVWQQFLFTLAVDLRHLSYGASSGVYEHGNGPHARP